MFFSPTHPAEQLKSEKKKKPLVKLKPLYEVTRGQEMLSCSIYLLFCTARPHDDTQSRYFYIFLRYTLGILHSACMNYLKIL